MTEEDIEYQDWGGTITEDQCPLTPLETWYLFRGYAVKPKKRITSKLFNRLPPDVEIVRGYVKFRNG